MSYFYEIYYRRRPGLGVEMEKHYDEHSYLKSFNDLVSAGFTIEDAYRINYGNSSDVTWLYNKDGYHTAGGKFKDQYAKSEF